MECLEVDRIPEGELWQYELKLDGYRMIAIKQDGDVHLFSRNGISFSLKFPSIVQTLELTAFVKLESADSRLGRQ